MSALEAAAIYIAVNLVVLLWLALACVAGRMRAQVMLGDGGDPALRRAVRAHANAAEYIPAALVGLVALSLLEPAVWVVHVLGGAFSVGRVLHGIGLLGSEGRSFGRAVGILLTWLVYLGLAVALVWFALA